MNTFSIILNLSWVPDINFFYSIWSLFLKNSQDYVVMISYFAQKKTNESPDLYISQNAHLHIRGFLELEQCFSDKAELLQLNRTQFLSLGIFVSKKVENRKN